MFDKFGEFDSVEELNKAAAAQLAEGDEEALYELAEENGIDKFDVDDYVDGIVPELANPLMAAMGKFEIEKSEFKDFDGMVMDDWLEYVKVCIGESEEMQRAVRRKGKTLRQCIVELLRWSFQNMKQVNKELAKEAGLNDNMASNLKLGIPNMKKAKDIIREYYMGGGQNESV